MRGKAEKIWKALRAVAGEGYEVLGTVEKITTHRAVEIDGELFRENALLPEGAVKLSYADAQKFLMEEIERIENRQVYYGNELEPLIYNLRIFWIHHKTGLGFGLVDDLPGKRIVLYRFGTARNWFLYKNKRLIQKMTKKHVEEDGSVLLL